MEANTLQAKDFRIRNYLYDKEDRLCIVSKLKDDFLVATSIGKHITSLPLKSIPISEDFLLKLGFENWGKGKHYKSDEYIRFVLHNVLDGTSNFEVHKIIDPEYFVISCDDNERINFGIDITYVHQLQNLYFGLVGEELTIKE